MTQLNLSKGFCVGDNLAVRSGNSITRYYTIIGRDALYGLQTALSAVSASSTSSLTQLTDFNPPQDLLYQVYRVEIVQGNVKINVYHPQSTTRFGTEVNTTAGIISDTNDHAPVDLFIFVNFAPAVQITNSTNVSVTPVLRLWGWTYRILQLPSAPAVYTQITVGGICR